MSLPVELNSSFIFFTVKHLYFLHISTKHTGEPDMYDCTVAVLLHGLLKLGYLLSINRMYQMNGEGYVRCNRAVATSKHRLALRFVRQAKKKTTGVTQFSLGNERPVTH